VTTVRQLRDEKGAVVAVWTIGIATLITAVLGIAVDLSGLVHAKQSAGDLAAQAARYAGQQINTGVFMNSGRVEVQARRAKAAAVEYLEAAGMTGTATVEGGTTLVVTSRLSWTPTFLGTLGIGPLEVTATATARVVRAHDGEEE